MKYSALIIDDERLARLTLRKDLEKFPEIDIIGEASGIESALLLIKQTQPDLLFLDIQLDDGNGFDLLNQIDFSGKVIFISAYDEYAIRAFEINAIDYLMKPLSVNRLRMAIDKLEEAKNKAVKETTIPLNYYDRLMINHRQSVHFIKVSSITFISASREYCYVHTIEGREYLSSKNISEWDKRLPEHNFCRIHRSTIINFDYIQQIEHHVSGTADVTMQGSASKLTISRSYYKTIKQKYSV